MRSLWRPRPYVDSHLPSVALHVEPLALEVRAEPIEPRRPLLRGRQKANGRGRGLELGGLALVDGLRYPAPATICPRAHAQYGRGRGVVMA